LIATGEVPGQILSAPRWRIVYYQLSEPHREGLMGNGPVTIHVYALGTGSTGLYGIGRDAMSAEFDLVTQVSEADGAVHHFTLTASTAEGMAATIRALLAECTADHVASVLRELGLV
jgi:hypothetical protein